MLMCDDGISSRPLILVGGGGHCKSVIEAAESAGRTVYGIIDMPEYVGSRVLGYEVVGSDHDIPKFASECDFVVTLGFIKNPAPRRRLHDLIDGCGGKLATVVASTASVSRHASLGEGTVVLHHASVNAGVRIGKGCIVNTQACVEHDAEISDYCHLSTGSIVNGDCRIGAETFVGSGTVVNNGVKIAPGCIIGSGSLVIRDIEKSGTYYGVPAKRGVKS